MTVLPAVMGITILVVMMACTPAAPSPQSAAPGPGARPGADERRAERLAMVQQQIVARGVSDPLVLAALRATPRHWFVPEVVAAHAYDDEPLPIGSDQTISQPYIVALMTELLSLQPGEKVLEIGTGSGYQAAVLSEITPHVFTIEIVPELAQRAQATFARHGYTTIQARQGDGYAGWPEHAPFDAIVVTAAPERVPPALLQQLAANGRLVIPVGRTAQDQELLVITRHADGTTSERSVAPVRFVPMTGEAQQHR
jgi:protein-L-isoaspartate(D-aspartate) O-methyltransferase